MASNVESSNYKRVFKSAPPRRKPPNKPYPQTPPPPPTPLNDTPISSPALSYTNGPPTQPPRTPTKSLGKRSLADSNVTPRGAPTGRSFTPTPNSPLLEPIPITPMQLDPAQLINPLPQIEDVFSQEQQTDVSNILKQLQDRASTEDQNDWSEEDHQYNRLIYARELIHDLVGVLKEANSEGVEYLKFVTDDKEFEDGLNMLSSLLPNTHTNFQLKPLLDDIYHIRSCMERMSDQLDKFDPPSQVRNKSLYSSIHAPQNGSQLPHNQNPPQHPPPQPEAKTKTGQPPKPDSLPPQNPNAAFHPSRLVVQFPPQGLPIERRPDPSTIVDKINTALTSNPQAKHLKVVAANFNNQGNLIISTRADQTAAHLIKFQNVISHIFTNIYNEQTPIIREDKKWFKIQVDGVSTGSLTIGNGRALHTPQAVHSELLACNPSYNLALKHMVANPRWLRADEELLYTPKSSLVFALTDEPTARQILNQKFLAAFGRHCSVRAFQDRPPVIQCRICWKLDHTSHQCKDTARCRLCSNQHTEEEHPHTPLSSCQKCQMALENGDSMDTSAEGHCPHNLSCTNCISNNIEDHHHPADARRCPSRLSKYGTARENERRAAKADNPWLKVKNKKTKPKPQTSLPKPTTNPHPQNRFSTLASQNTQLPTSDPNLMPT